MTGPTEDLLGLDVPDRSSGIDDSVNSDGLPRQFGAKGARLTVFQPRGSRCRPGAKQRPTSRDARLPNTGG